MNSSELSHGIREAGGKKLQPQQTAQIDVTLEWEATQTKKQGLSLQDKQPHHENEGHERTGHLTIHKDHSLTKKQQDKTNAGIRHHAKQIPNVGVPYNTT